MIDQFIQALSERPAKLNLLAWYTIGNGVLYLVLGASLYVAPANILAIFAGLDPNSGEIGMLRVIGVAVAIIGWFYVMGGRTNAVSFGLATVVDRLLLPLLLAPLVLLGSVSLMSVAPLGLLDPLLGIGAFVVWRYQVEKELSLDDL